MSKKPIVRWGGWSHFGTAADTSRVAWGCEKRTEVKGAWLHLFHVRREEAASHRNAAGGRDVVLTARTTTGDRGGYCDIAHKRRQSKLTRRRGGEQTVIRRRVGRPVFAEMKGQLGQGRRLLPLAASWSFLPLAKVRLRGPQHPTAHWRLWAGSANAF
jgi:hypothetical protein